MSVAVTTERELLLDRTESKTARVAVVGLAYSPERIDPGNKMYTLANTPKVVEGTTEGCAEVALAFYGKVIAHPVSSTQIAEITDK